MALVRTTVGRQADAQGMARRLVETGLAACVHAQEIRSTYRWQGKVHDEPEWLVEARALPAKATAVRRAMLDMHPYEVPLVEVVPVSGIPGAYLAWARDP